MLKSCFWKIQFFKNMYIFFLQNWNTYTLCTLYVHYSVKKYLLLPNKNYVFKKKIILPYRYAQMIWSKNRAFVDCLLCLKHFVCLFISQSNLGSNQNPVSYNFLILDPPINFLILDFIKHLYPKPILVHRRPKPSSQLPICLLQI